MPSRAAGAYMVRASERFPAELMIDMWTPWPCSENRTPGGPVTFFTKLSASALASIWVDSPPSHWHRPDTAAFTGDSHSICDVRSIRREDRAHLDPSITGK